MSAKTTITLAALTIAASAATAGTWEQVIAHPEGGCYVLDDSVAYLSAAAFAADKADELRGGGILGYHLPYDPKTKKSTINHSMMVLKHWLKYGGPSPIDLSETTPSLFWVDGEIWKYPQDFAGYRVTSNPNDLKECSA